MDEKWIGVDLDGTLAVYEYGYVREGMIGEPILPMLNRVKYLLEHGKIIKIFTGRVAQDTSWIPKIQDWCEAHGLPRLEVTNIKDHLMECLYDDRAITIEKNTGRVLTCVEDCDLR